MSFLNTVRQSINASQAQKSSTHGLPRHTSSTSLRNGGSASISSLSVPVTTSHTRNGSRSGSPFMGGPSRAGSPGPSGSISSGSRRRAREDDDVDVDNEIVKRARVDRLQALGNSLCAAEGLPPSTIQDFVQLELFDMLVTLKVDISRMERSFGRYRSGALLDSEQFKTTLSDRIHVCFMSPNNYSYLHGLADRVLNIIQAKPDLFMIPAELFHDPEAYSQLSDMVREILTSLRSNTKQKLIQFAKKAVLNDPAPIGALTRSIMPRSTNIDGIHCSRAAVIHQGFTHFCEKFGKASDQALVPAGAPGTLEYAATLEDVASAPDEEEEVEDSQPREEDAVDAPAEDGAAATDAPGGQDEDTGDPENNQYAPTKFWEYMDDLLRFLRLTIKRGTTDRAVRARLLDEQFTIALQRDMAFYPSQDGRTYNDVMNLTSVSLPWQAALELAMAG